VSTKDTIKDTIVPAVVFVVDDRHDVLELNRILLEAEGYRTEGYSYAALPLDRLRSQAPDVILLDLLPDDEAPWTLLRRLRRDPLTEAVGAVVTSDSAALVDRALNDKSLRVSAGLGMPFDIDALYTAVADAARRGAHAAPPAVLLPLLLLQRAATALRHSRARVLLTWVQLLTTLDEFRQRPSLTLAEVQGHGGALLDLVIGALELQSTSRTATAVTVGVRVDAAHDHARLRREQGLGVGTLAREVAALRREVWQTVYPVVAAEAPPLDDLWDLLRRLDMALDELLYAMLDTWDAAYPAHLAHLAHPGDAANAANSANDANAVGAADGGGWSR